MKILKNPNKIRRHTYTGFMSMLNTDGDLLFQLQSCKDTWCAYVASVGVRNSKYGLSMIRNRQGSIDLMNPKFVMSITSSRDDSASLETAQAMEEAAQLVAQETGKPIDVSYIEDARLVVLEVDPVYISNCVAAHSVMTFVRPSALRPRLNRTNIHRYIADVTAQGSSLADSKHMRIGALNDNIYGFLNLNLPIFELGLDSWNTPINGSLFVAGMVKHLANSRFQAVRTNEQMLNSYGTAVAGRDCGGYRQWL